MTNFEKIKSMNFNEMKQFLIDLASCDNCARYQCCVDKHEYDCDKCTKEWLESEVNGIDSN